MDRTPLERLRYGLQAIGLGADYGTKIVRYWQAELNPDGEIYVSHNAASGRITVTLVKPNNTAEGPEFTDVESALAYVKSVL